MNMSDTTLPVHLGIILDGNRRWAKAKGLPTLEGHRQGSETFKEIALAAFDRGIKYVSAYVFSTENWSRTQEEVRYIMDLAVRVADTQLDEFHQRGIKIVILGSREKLNPKVLKAIDKVEAKTKDNTAGTIALCFNYGGRQEIVEAVKALIAAGEEPDEENIAGHLYAPEVPDADLIIRTSGEHRISGYMLWRASYSELYFTDKYWPDFSEADLDLALNDYSKRQRRFGS